MLKEMLLRGFVEVGGEKVKPWKSSITLGTFGEEKVASENVLKGSKEEWDVCVDCWGDWLIALVDVFCG